jgi:class 3 adenylate cyclase
MTQAALHEHEQAWASECLICSTALTGVASVPFKLVGISRSARNPNLCNRCNTHAEEGRVAEITVLFADLSSFTELTHDLGPERTHEVVDAFLQMATYCLVRQDAFIDKYVGDAVMAFFNVPIRREDHSARAVAAGQEILAGIPSLNDRFGLNLGAVVAIATGYARVGRLGSSDGKDYTAIGDVVNLAARLEGVASRGEIVMDQAVYAAVQEQVGQARVETVALKGFKDPVQAYHLGQSSGSQRLSGRAETDQSSSIGLLLTRLGALVFGVLGAPCAIGTLIGPLAVVVGFGALFSALASSVLDVLDSAPIRIPALVLATLGALANVYTIWRARQIRLEAPVGSPFAMTTVEERRRARAVLALAILTLLAVGFELYAHSNIMGHSWP